MSRATKNFGYSSSVSGYARGVIDVTCDRKILGYSSSVYENARGVVDVTCDRAVDVTCDRVVGSNKGDQEQELK